MLTVLPKRQQQTLNGNGAGNLDLFVFAAGYIREFYKTRTKEKLSKPALESLAIIAYKQPVTKTEVEQIRGVNCDYSIQKLLEKDLIEIEGKGEGPGRPIIYVTSQTFMDYFGIKSVKDLPQLKDLHQEQNEIGTPSELNENLLDLQPEVTASGQLTETIVAETTETEETFITEETDLDRLPDRKAIFLEHESSQEEKEDASESKAFPGDEDLDQ